MTDPDPHTQQPVSTSETRSHERFIGEEIERALEIIGEEAGDLDAYQLLSAYADGDLDPDVELRGNYLHVSVEGKTAALPTS